MAMSSWIGGLCLFVALITSVCVHSALGQEEAGDRRWRMGCWSLLAIPLVLLWIAQCIEEAIFLAILAVVFASAQTLSLLFPKRMRLLQPRQRAFRAVLVALVCALLWASLCCYLSTVI